VSRYQRPGGRGRVGETIGNGGTLFEQWPTSVTDLLEGTAQALETGEPYLEGYRAYMRTGGSLDWLVTPLDVPTPGGDVRRSRTPSKGLAVTSGTRRSRVRPPTAPTRVASRHPASARTPSSAITLRLPAAGTAPRMASGALEDAGCTPYISGSVSKVGLTVRIDYLAEVLCNFYLAGAGQAYLFERTSGSPYNGQVVAAATPFSFVNGYYGYSAGAVVIDGRYGDLQRACATYGDAVRPACYAHLLIRGYCRGGTRGPGRGRRRRPGWMRTCRRPAGAATGPFVPRASYPQVSTAR
jgi:hypothetical protein